MKKITELTEKRLRTVEYVDDHGQRYFDKEEVDVWRTVKTIEAGPRLAHFVADMIMLQILFSVLNYFFELVYKQTEPYRELNLTITLLLGLFSLLFYLIYYTFSEYCWQRSPGKFLTKSIVIDEYGNRPELRVLILRSIIRMLPFEAFSCTDSYSYGWHDKWSGTWVVTENELAEIKRLQMEQAE